MNASVARTPTRPEPALSRSAESRARAAPVIALCDGSATARQAAWRAALVARNWGSPLRLLRCVAHPDHHDEARRQLVKLAAELHERCGIEAGAEVVQGDVLRAATQAAQDCRLMVIGCGPGNTLREWVMGTQAERLIRLLKVPVLVAKQMPVESYRRLLVPVDLGAGSDAALALAASLSVPGQPIEVFHALPRAGETPPGVADAPEAPARSRRRRLLQRARALLQQLIGGVHLGRVRAQPFVRVGDAAALVVERARAIQADVVVIGKRRRGLLADFFLGSVTQRVLAAAAGDVLVITVGPRQALLEAPQGRALLTEGPA